MVQSSWVGVLVSRSLFLPSVFCSFASIAWVVVDGFVLYSDLFFLRSSLLGFVAYRPRGSEIIYIMF